MPGCSNRGPFVRGLRLLERAHRLGELTGFPLHARVDPRVGHARIGVTEGLVRSSSACRRGAGQDQIAVTEQRAARDLAQPRARLFVAPEALDQACVAASARLASS